MKTLILIRHAKSDWGNELLSDRYRPLNARGHSDAPAMAERLRNLGVKPDKLISSPALRAMTTALYFTEGFSLDPGIIQMSAALYETGEKEYLRVIRGTEANVNTLLIFAHNPVITTLANRLGNLRTDNVPTCGAAAFQFRIGHWSDVEKGELLFYEFPKKRPE
ncbi:MAG: histidine phosphatase family protein [Bacteroidia bacterium]|nr:histidine phosphatase family protein [Bacteroidia bacterium]